MTLLDGEGFAGLGVNERMPKLPAKPAAAPATFAGKACLLAVSLALTACNSPKPKIEAKAELDTAPKFSEAQMQVQESPRVTEARDVPKGGGRYQVGKPYKVRGKWYKPVENQTYAASGKASWYGPNFHGRLTANGEIYNQYGISAAHPTMPLPSYARVTNLQNGMSVIVRVNDRGPYAHGRIIDLSGKAAELLGYRSAGIADVKVEYVGKARIDGQDDKFLLASFRAPGMPETVPGGTQPGTMIAMADETGNPVVAAIDTQIAGETSLESQISGVLLASVPVPTPRPAYYLEGTPMLLSANGRLALGYTSHDTLAERFAAAFDAVDNQPLPFKQPSTTQIDIEAAARSARILIGYFADHDAAAFVQQQFADVGLVSARRAQINGTSVIELTMLAGGDAVDAALAIAKQRGMSSARRID